MTIWKQPALASYREVPMKTEPESKFTKKFYEIGHFRVPKTLTFKMRLGAQPFLSRWVLFAWEWKMISISKAEHLPSFWNRGLGEIGRLSDSIVRTYQNEQSENKTRANWERERWRREKCLPSPRAFFAFLFTERLFTTISEPGTG